MVIIIGMRAHSDPKPEKCEDIMRGDKLYVRGYIGMSVLGRTQVWKGRHPLNMLDLQIKKIG